MAARGSGRWAPDGDARRQAVPRLETLNQGVHHVPDADHLLVPSGGAAIVGMAEQLRGRCGRRHHRGGGDWERHGAVDAVAGMALADGDVPRENDDALAPGEGDRGAAYVGGLYELYATLPPCGEGGGG
ncbi:Os03g0293800 [Oryza sativa Japonica Group]|nr:Os03g0293800 [Oryza sativa Japonica Group]